MNTKLPYTAIILAAGYSSRMERFKPLLEIGGRTICDRLTGLYRDQGIDVILVAGWQKEQLSSGINDRNVLIVDNLDFASGMFSSVVAGLSQVRQENCRAVFVHPVDIPLVRPYTIRRLLETAEGHPGAIIYPLCAGQRGHPVLLPSAMIPSILEWRGEGGLKAVLENQAGPAIEVKVPDSFIHRDMDSFADYQALLTYFQAYEIPSSIECEMVLDIMDVAPDRRRHSFGVEAIAARLAEALAVAGIRADPALVKSAAVLHDMAKGQKDHAGLGACTLREMGFGKTGEVVAAHSDLPDGPAGSSLEAKIVFLADKYIAGETPVSLDERYGLALERFATDNQIRAAILQRKETAVQVKGEFEKILGQPLEDVIRS